MQDTERIVFTKEMKKDYTILLPNMLSMHFKILCPILNTCGYKAELLENADRAVIEAGLKYVHNDTCYPALLIIGQFLNALQSGKYDVNKTALLLTQTGLPPASIPPAACRGSQIPGRRLLRRSPVSADNQGAAPRQVKARQSQCFAADKS